jgi:superfamily II DNA/RNA helicase
MKFKPTQIQALAYPVIFQGSNCILNSETGSGKTLAYLNPIVNRLSALEKQQTHRFSPRCLILTLNRQLESQILSEIKSMSSSKNLISCVFPIPVSIPSSHFHFPDIYVSTPNAVFHAFNTYKKMQSFFKSTESVVFDEADILLSQKEGIEILKNVSTLSRKDHLIQRIFVAATLPRIPNESSKTPRALMKRECPDVMEIETMDAFKIPKGLKETFIEVENEEQKKEKLMEWMHEHENNRILIFCNRIDTAQALHEWMQDKKHAVELITGDQDHLTRSQGLNQAFSNNNAIITTGGLLSRGIDLPSVDLVINFDQPQNQVDYLHRVGRTARAGTAGLAFTFVKKSLE